MNKSYWWYLQKGPGQKSKIQNYKKKKFIIQAKYTIPNLFFSPGHKIKPQIELRPTK